MYQHTLNRCMPYQCLWYSCLFDSFYILMIMIMITLMISMIILLMINMIVLYICAISLFYHISHVFRNGLVYCVMVSFGMKRIMSVIRRSVLGKMHIDVICVEKCILLRKPCMYTKESTMQIMYVMFYFCIECKLYEFLTYMMYMWTKNVSWFTWYCTLL